MRVILDDIKYNANKWGDAYIKGVAAGECYSFAKSISTELTDEELDEIGVYYYIDAFEVSQVQHEVVLPSFATYIKALIHIKQEVNNGQ